MENENNEATKVTPTLNAMNTADNTNTATADATTDTATVENKANDGKVTEQKSDNTASDKTNKDGLPPGVKKRLWEQSEKLRRLEAELKKYQDNHAKQEPTKVDTTKTVDSTVQESNLLDDPEKWANGIEGKILSKAEERILARIEQAETEKRILAEAEKAKDYILNKPEFGTDEALTEIQTLIATPEVQAICKTSPQKGAEYAEYLWRKAKGLDKASVDVANANAAKSTSVKPTGNTETGKKTWTTKEVDEYLRNFMHPDFAKRRAEIMQAQKEGRIKL